METKSAAITIAQDGPSPGKGKRLGRTQLFLLAICTLGFVVDTGEIAIATALGAIFTASGGRAASTEALTMLFASVYLGGALGAIGFGLLAKRLSARFALALAMAVLGVASLAAALAPTIEWLIFARGIGGLGIGAYPPLAIALLATHLPARYRGPLTLLVSAVGTLGAPLAIYATRQLSYSLLWQFAGWQTVLIVGAWLALITSIGFVMLRGLDEGTAADVSASDAACDRLRDRTNRFTAKVVLPALYVLVFWVGAGFQLLSGIIFLQKGYNLNDALLFVTALLFGPALGTAMSGVVIDRFNRRDAILTTLFVSALAVLVFGAVDAAWILGVASVVFGMAMGLFAPLVSLYAAEFYPEAKRSEATTRLWAMNRVGLVIAPLLLLPILRGAGALALTLVLAMILVGCAALVRFAPRGHAGEELV